MTRILGIDPGLQHTGWGIIDHHDNHFTFIACGCINSHSNQTLAPRLLNIHNKLKEVILQYKPDQCAIEETFVNKNPQSSLKLGHARGAALLTISQSGITPYEYAATLIKKSIVGNGRADKQQITAMVKHILPKAITQSEDAADALAVAICHTHHQSFNNILEQNT